MKRTLITATLLVAASFSAHAEDTVAGLVETYDHPRLGATISVQDQTWKHEHLTILMSQGVAAPVMAGDETIGIYFRGTGTWDYVSVDPAEFTVMETNTRSSTNLKVEKTDSGRVLRDSFTELFLWTSSVERPLIAEPSAAEAASDPALAEKFKAHRELFGRDRMAVGSFVFVKAKLDRFEKPLVRAQFSGGKENAVYLHDPLLSHSEKIYTLHEARGTSIREYQKALWPAVLSEQVVGYGRKDFIQPEFVLFGLDYTLTADGDEASLSVAETIIPFGSPQRVFRFNQTSTDYDSNTKMRRYNVRKVTDASGKELSYVHREGELLVGLPAAAPADQPFVLRFEIDGDFLYRPSGDSYWELGTSPWFPQPELNGQYYTIHSTIKVKKPFVPFAPGVTVRRVVEGDYNVVENRIDKPVQFAVALAGRYSFEEETQNGLTIRIATYGLKNELAMKKLTNLAFKMIAFYEPFLGPFPFTEYNIIEINEYGFGQGPPATMFITSEAFNPVEDDVARIFSKGINHRFAHEIAHQYWGHVVKMGSLDEQWITESFAEYSSSFIVGQIKGKSGKQSMLNTWKANANNSKNKSSIAMANRLRDYGDMSRAFMHRTHLVYDKGAWVLSKLHAEIGDQMFLSFLRNLQALKAWKFLSTAEMAPLLQHLTKKDYSSFFDQYYWGTDMP